VFLLVLVNLISCKLYNVTVYLAYASDYGGSVHSIYRPLPLVAELNDSCYSCDDTRSTRMFTGKHEVT